MPARIFRQLGGGLLRGLLEDYMAWFMARPKIRGRVTGGSRQASRPAIY